MTARRLESQLDLLLQTYQGAVPGACVMVLREGVPVVRLAYGLADLASAIPTTPATNFRIASLSKQFTAAAVLLLAEEGLLTIDDFARRWLPSLPQAAAEVTIRQLLTHRSGLIDYEEVIPRGTAVQLRNADVLKLLESADRTYFRPGTGYRYSNSGYALLALIVQRASGEAFAAFLQRRIFRPLQMLNSIAFESGISVIANRAYGYSASGISWTFTDQSLTSATLGDGGIYSSIDDLAKWDAALYDARLLRPESLRSAFMPATDTDDAAVRYGFGWRITGESLWHSGETMGFRCVILRYPAHRFSVIMLTNRDGPAPYSTALDIAKLFLPDADAQRAKISEAGPDSGNRPLPIA